MKKIPISFALLFMISSMPVQAYIDPGSGSAIISAIIGFFVAIGVVIKTFWFKILSILGLSKTSENENEISKKD